MPQRSTITWKLGDVVELANVSTENIMLELPSGLQRLDAGRTIRIEAKALDLAPIKALVDAGKIKVEPYKMKVEPYRGKGVGR